MIAALVLFWVPAGTTLPQITESFEQSAPRFCGLPGLISKQYLFDGETRAGAFYLWSSRELVTAFFDDKWKQVLTERYGSPPSLSVFEVPVSIDNSAGR